MMDAHREAYQEEARELLTELESVLLALEESPGDHELIDSAFRALHTIKGSGAMFGFDEIADFAHGFEAVFDQVREGDVPVTGGLITLSLTARDHLRAILESEGADPALIEEGERISRDLAALARATEVAEGEEKCESSAPGEGETADLFRIRFRPHEDCFLSGTNPLLLLDELRELGVLLVNAKTDGVPALEDCDPEKCYTEWRLLLVTQDGENSIRDVFIFVEDDAELEIKPVQPGDLSQPEQEWYAARETLAPTDSAKAVHPAEISSAQPNGVAGKASPGSKASGSVRVAAAKLDSLMNIVGELVTLQAHISTVAQSSENPEFQTLAENMEHITEQLRSNATDLRMLAVGATFNRARRLVRDLSGQLGKQAELLTAGEDTELDKTIIDSLNDPLVHLIRNAMDHGIESPEERLAAGKAAAGTIRLSAEHAGADVMIRVADDGAGLDRPTILNRAIERGLVTADEALSDKEVFDLILQPGFSTVRQVTEVSGRGVGMDVVRRSIEALNGSLHISSKKGEGTCFELRLPLTLGIIDGLLVEVAGDKYVIPISSVLECVEILTGQQRQRGEGMITTHGELVGCLRLRTYFNREENLPEIEHAVIAQTASGKLGFIVDRVIGDYQTVIKRLSRLYRNVENISGATVLGDGTIALILNVDQLASEAVTRNSGN